MELVIRETDGWFLTRSGRLSKESEAKCVSQGGYSNELDVVRHNDGSLVLLDAGTVNR
jgi:hypothetical protein